jgi:hypothetical protein
MPPDPATTAAGGFGKRLLTMPAALRHHGHDLMYLLDWEQHTEAPTVPGLAAALASRRYCLALSLHLGRIGRRRPRGAGRVLAEPGFQLAYAPL